MNVLVTGGSGFIGSHIVDELINSGYSVRVLDIKPPHRNDVDFFKGSILSLDNIEKSLEDIDIVYHLGGFSNIDMVKGSPLETIQLNIEGTANLLDVSRQKKKVRRFIFASSVYVHDSRGHLYTTSKLASELICKNYYNLYGLPYTILRYGTVYGPRSRDVDVISVFIRKALDSGRITINGSGNQKRNFIFTQDVAKGSIRAMEAIAENKTYCIAYPRSFTINELAQTIKKIVNPELIIQRDYNNVREDDYLGEIDNLEETFKDLSWRPEYGLEEGIKAYLKWYKKK
jgi:UDP-glucose 4-epimerase